MTDQNHRGAALLDGPVGRRVLFEIARDSADLPTGAFDAHDDWDTHAHARTSIGELVDAGMQTALRLAETGSDRLLALVGRVILGFAHGSLAQERPLLDHLHASSDLFMPLAVAIGQAEGTRWWWAPVAPDQLVAEGCSGFGVVDEATVDAWPARWWSAPTGPGIVHSSRPAPDGSPVALWLAEDHWVPVDDPSSCALDVGGRSPLEITCAEDWQRLVDRFPVRRTRSQGLEWDSFAGSAHAWVDLDWVAVREVHAGIHLTVAAHLEAAYRPLPVDGGHTMLAGWNPDVTVWLDRDVSALPAAVYRS